MATYITKVDLYSSLYGAEAKSAAEWQKKFHDVDGVGYKKAAEMWKERLDDFVADGKSEPAVKKIRPAVKVDKESLKKEIAVEVKKTEPAVKVQKKVEYKVTDETDPHQYEYVREEFDKEKDRDARIGVIQKSDKLSYISSSWGDRKYNVCYWKQID